MPSTVSDLEQQSEVCLPGAGNAWTSTAVDNKGAVDFWWSHAIISDESRYGMLHSCNFSGVGPLQGGAPPQLSGDSLVGKKTRKEVTVSFCRWQTINAMCGVCVVAILAARGCMHTVG